MYSLFYLYGVNVNWLIISVADDNQLANDDNSLDGGSLASEAASLEYSQSGHNEAGKCCKLILLVYVYHLY